MRCWPIPVRRAAKVDRNQPEIVAALRAIGASVQPLHTIGQGCPDLLCGWRGRHYLIEVKDGLRPLSERRLTDDQRKWIESWQAPVIVAESADEAIVMLQAAT